MIKHFYSDNHDNYAAAVCELYKLAMEQDNKGACIAAQVLLSCCNGSICSLQPPLLANLALCKRKLAYLVLVSCTELRMEPHECLENGQKRFCDLVERWNDLNRENMVNPLH